MFAGDPSSASYRVEDMAEDAAALLAELDIARTHVVGASMGGMITQALVINHGERCLSACSIMSTTGDRSVGAPTGEAMSRAAAAHGEQPGGGHRGLSGGVEGDRLAGLSHGREASCATVPAAAYDRAYRPEGTARQLGAILASPDRTEGSAGVRLPFLVIHGEADPLVTPSGGQATAAAVPGAKLLTFPGMGHDLPRATVGRDHRRHRRQHGVGGRLSNGQSPRALAATTDASQAALGLAVRAKVTRSTPTMPKRGR